MLSRLSVPAFHYSTAVELILWRALFLLGLHAIRSLVGESEENTMINGPIQGGTNSLKEMESKGTGKCLSYHSLFQVVSSLQRILGLFLSSPIPFS